MTGKRIMILAASLAVLALLAVGGFAAVVAAETPAATGEATQPTRAQQFLNQLASNLGISTDRLQQGLKETGDQIVDNAVANGSITQTQADKAKQRIDAGNGLNAFTHVFARHAHRAGLRQLGSWQAIAGVLSMTPQQLRSQIESGRTLQEIITSQNKSVDDVVNAVVAQVKQRLDAAVANGSMTPQREETVLNQLKTRLTDLINNGGPTFDQQSTPGA